MLKMCTAKETVNKIKRQPTEREQIFANKVTEKELISKNVQNAHSAQYQENKQPN